MANVYGLIFEIDDKTKSGARSINRNLDSISNKANSVKKGLAGVGKIAGSAVSALGKTAVAATAAATAFAFLAKKNLDALDSLGKTASKLGVSTKFLSSYGFVAKQAGLSTDQFNTGLQRFIRRLGQAQQGSGELVKPLAQLGINMKDANGNFREGTDVFQEFLTKLGSTSNNAQRLALAMGAFDTEGVAFINIAKLGSQGIANLRKEAELAGIVISDKLAKGAEDANDAISELLSRGRGFGFNFFANLAPGIEKVADDLKKALDGVVAEAGGMEKFSRNLAGSFTTAAADVIDSLASVFDGFINGFRTLSNGIKQVLASLPSQLTGGVEYQMGDGNIDELKARKAEIVTQLKSAADEMGVPLEDLFNRFGGTGGLKSALAGVMHPFLHSEAKLLNEEYGELAQRITQIEQGAVVFLSMTEANSNTAAAVKGTTDKLREMGKVLSDTNAKELTAAEIRERAEASIQKSVDEELALAAARYASANALVESLKPQQTELQKLEAHLNAVRTAQDLWYEGFTNGANRMGTGYQEMVRFTGGIIALNEEYRKTADAIALVKRQMTYAETPENEMIDRHAALTVEMLKTEQAILRVKAAMAVQGGDMEAYIFALKTLEEQQERISSSLNPGGSTAPAPTRTAVAEANPITSFDDYYKSLSDGAKNAANEIGYAARAQEKLAKALKDGKISAEAFDIAMEKTNETLGNSNPYIDNIENAIKGLSGSIASNFTDVIFGLKDGFTALQDIALSVLRTIIQTLIETFIKQQMVAAFGGGAGGGLGALLGGASMIPGLGLLAGAGMLLGGMFADGGSTASAGQKPILVGERGPEIFMPGKAGTVVPNEELNSNGGGDLTVNFNLQAIDTQTGTQFLLENKRVITGVIQEAYRRRGSQGPLG